MTFYHGLSVEKRDVKRIKNLIESKNMQHSSLKIRKDDTDEERMVIPTCVECTLDHPPDALSTLAFPLVQVEQKDCQIMDQGTPLTRALREGSRIIPLSFWDIFGLSVEDVVRHWKPSPPIYPPMLLLKAHMLAHGPFERFFSLLQSNNVEHAVRDAFWASVASSMRVTHIALDAPVLANLPPTATDSNPTANILRSPTNFHPIHGDFGPALPAPPAHVPTQQDFAAAFWATTRQNGIQQTWAPRHTMFSAGNTSEKARILHLPTLHPPSTAADLFAGIGYFALSYAAARAAPVLAWDLNGWSAEALRRNAAANGHAVAQLAAGAPDAAWARALAAGARVLVAAEDNVEAGRRVRALRAALPPVRHVNCGVLPGAPAPAVRVACEVLDARAGGWLHLHEGVEVERVAERVDEVRRRVEGCARALRSGGEADVVVEHVQRVKSLGPRLVHVVVDVFVPGSGLDEWVV